jgi:hypothetical protein
MATPGYNKFPYKQELGSISSAENPIFSGIEALTYAQYWFNGTFFASGA